MHANANSPVSYANVHSPYPQVSRDNLGRWPLHGGARARAQSDNVGAAVGCHAEPQFPRVVLNRAWVHAKVISRQGWVSGEQDGIAVGRGGIAVSRLCHFGEQMYWFCRGESCMSKRLSGKANPRRAQASGLPMLPRSHLQYDL